MYSSYVPYTKKGIYLNVKLKVYHKGINWKQLSNIITNIKKDTSPLLKKFRKEVSLTIASIIERNRKRNKATRRGGLADYFKSQATSDLGVRSYRDELLLGIGRLEELNSKYKYWAALNYGSSHMVGRYVARGFFVNSGLRPSTRQGFKDRWTLNNEGYVFKVTKPIVGIHYLEKAREKLMPKWNELWVKYWAKRKALSRRYKI